MFVRLIFVIVSLRRKFFHAELFPNYSIYDQFKETSILSASLSANSDEMVTELLFLNVRHRSSSLIPGIPDLTMHCGSDCGGRSWIWLVPLVNDS